jgi:ribose 5-phosphate isomerase B
MELAKLDKQYLKKEKIMKIKIIYFTGTYNTRYLAEKLKDIFSEANNEFEVIEIGKDTPVADLNDTDLLLVGYPIYGFKLGEAIRDHEVIKGIAICGSGIGISIACNKVKGVRCAKVNNVNEVKWTVRDNDANVIALSSKMPMFRVKDIVDVFLKTNFSNLERHKKRITMLDEYKG